VTIEIFIAIILICDITFVYIVFNFPYKQILEIKSELEMMDKQQKKELLKEKGINIGWYWLFCTLRHKDEQDNI
jgi:hypothetical protein